MERCDMTKKCLATCADAKALESIIRNVDSICERRSQGAKPRSTYDTHAGMEERIWDELGEGLESCAEWEIFGGHRGVT
jgi:hypothetical protein